VCAALQEMAAVGDATAKGSCTTSDRSPLHTRGKPQELLGGRPRPTHLSGCCLNGAGFLLGKSRPCVDILGPAWNRTSSTAVARSVAYRGFYFLHGKRKNTVIFFSYRMIFLISSSNFAQKGSTVA